MAEPDKCHLKLKLSNTQILPQTLCELFRGKTYPKNVEERKTLYCY